MNYLLVKREDLGDKFPYAEMLPEPDGRVILPCNYIKVLAGVSVQVIGYQELIDLKAKLTPAVAAEGEQPAETEEPSGSENTETSDEVQAEEKPEGDTEEHEATEQPAEEEGETTDNQPETVE